MAFRHAFRALRHPPFRRYWLGWAISVLGSWMQTVAQGWLLYRLTNSPQALGLLTALRFGPSLVGLPFAGVLTDFFPRRRLLAATQAAGILQASLLAWLAFSGQVVAWHILALALFQGLIDTLDMPARQSFQGDLVPVEDLQSAVSLNSTVFNAGRLLGPAVAGMVVAAYGESWCFALNALSFVPFFFAVLSVDEGPTSPRKDLAVFRQLAEGFSYAWGERKIRRLLAGVWVTATFGLAYSTLLPAFAKTTLGTDARGYGLLLAASGLGAMFGSLSVAAREDQRGRGWRVLVAQGVLGLALGTLALARTLWLAGVALVFAGAAVAAQLATTNGYIQTHSPPFLRARLISLYIWIFSGSTPLGGLWAGALAQKLGIPWALGLGGAFCLVSTIALPMRQWRAKKPAVSRGP
jgi:MFS family permease